MIYGVTAQVVVERNGWKESIQTPSFRIEASSDGEAEKVAAEIINPTRLPGLELHICVVAL